MPEPTRAPWTRALVILLRLSAVMLLLALVAVFMPERWMALLHGYLQLGPFPAAPLTDYLTRSASLLYAFHGGLLWLASTDPRRLDPLVSYMIFAGLAFGAGMLGIDIVSGMPLSWTLSEGPGIMVGCALFRLLQLRSRTERGE